MKKFFSYLTLLFIFAKAQEGFLIQESNQEKQEIKIGQEVKSPTPLAKSKNGAFLGVEIAFNVLEVYQAATITTGDKPNLYTSDTITTSIGADAGLVMGYQQYFDSEQKHGIKFSSHFYGGTPTKMILEFKNSANTEFQFIPIKVGADLKYLWDFFNQDNHTLGLSVGLGYELSYFISTDLQINNSMGEKITTKFDDMFIQNIYPTIGLHYYLENHQFEINYRFGGIQSANSSKINNPKDNQGYPLFDFMQTTLSQSSYISFNYTYKF